MKTNKVGKIVKVVLWVILLVIVFGGLFIYWKYCEYYPSTDDAYIQAHVVRIAPQVSGPVENIYIKNNQNVKKGQMLFTIDSAPFVIAVKQAKAYLDLARQKMQSLEDVIDSAKALVYQRESELEVTTKNARRTLALVKRGQASKAAGDNAENAVKVARASLAAALSQLEEAREELGEKGKHNAQMRATQAGLNKAELDLKHTQVIAPIDGKIVNFTARAGTMVQAGVPLFDLVEQSQWWVNANFKETQLSRIRQGMPAEIAVDMYPSHHFKGTVESISAGSGSAFSLLPPENATGNWVKITQRVPVKVVFKNLSSQYPLRVGASSVVTVNTVKASK